MKLALSAPLPPWTIPSAGLAAGLLRELQQYEPVVALVETPYRVRAGLVPTAQLRALCDLPPMQKAGDVGLPVYLVGDDPLHLHQLRFVRSHPGVLILPSLELGRLRACFDADLRGRKLPFVRDLGRGADLAAELAEMSRAVVVGSDDDARALRAKAPNAAVHVVPGLHSGDLAAAALGLRDVASKLRGMQPPKPAPQDWPAVTAVVIGYNSKDIVGPCLQTLLDQDYPNLEVVVVDNASADGTAEFVRTNFPQIKLIASTENLGFAEGNNLVFRTSNAKYIALLNQDAYAARNWITELVRCAEMDESIGSVGSKMLFHRCPTLINSTAIEINEAGWGWDRQVGERDENPSPMPEEVFGGCGGAVLYRKSALDAVGGFDPAFFMYYEDTDLAWRLRLAGYHNLYAPMAVVRHDFHGDTGATPGRLFRRRFMSERNRWATLVKNLDWASLRAILPRIRRYDRGRIEWLEKAVRDGHNPEFHGQIAKIIKQAWSWNLLRLPQLLMRRRRTQKLRKVSHAEGRRFLVAGINEGGHQGDVDNFHDRWSAKSRAAIAMGDTDEGSIGSGWHPFEKPPGADAAYRWCKGRAWFYLAPPSGTQVVQLRLASPLRPHKVTLYAEDQALGTCSVDAHAGNYCFVLPADLPRDQLLEFTIESETVRPIDAGLSQDIRDLGVVVFGMHCAEEVPPGVAEGQHFVGRGFDRDAAPRRAAIVMGETDDGVLGVGFHDVERPGPGVAYRWCGGRAHAYLQPPSSASAIVCKLASPLRPHQLKLFAEAKELGEVTVAGGAEEFRFVLPPEIGRDVLVELTLESETAKPRELGKSPDDRDLGVLVFELRAE
ncbi:MAG: glycosyltransferase family 2 protein [Planctomycetota bacterium]